MAAARSQVVEEDSILTRNIAHITTTHSITSIISSIYSNSNRCNSNSSFSISSTNSSSSSKDTRNSRGISTSMDTVKEEEEEEEMTILDREEVPSICLTDRRRGSLNLRWISLRRQSTDWSIISVFRLSRLLSEVKGG